MKRFLFAVAALTLAISTPVYAKGCISTPVYAKGCIKGAIVGGVAGSAVGYGKLGAAAGCVVGHHEANKADAEKSAPPAATQPSK